MDDAWTVPQKKNASERIQRESRTDQRQATIGHNSNLLIATERTRAAAAAVLGVILSPMLPTSQVIGLLARGSHGPDHCHQVLSLEFAEPRLDM
jgi:hypothetical protein